MIATEGKKWQTDPAELEALRREHPESFEEMRDAKFSVPRFFVSLFSLRPEYRFLLRSPYVFLTYLALAEQLRLLGFRSNIAYRTLRALLPFVPRRYRRQLRESISDVLETTWEKDLSGLDGISKLVPFVDPNLLAAFSADVLRMYLRYPAIAHVVQLYGQKGGDKKC